MCLIHHSIMFITQSLLQNEEATLLQTGIDNRCGRLHVGLRSFHYEVGYHNVTSASKITVNYDPRSIPHEPSPKRIRVPPGMYDFDSLSRFFEENISGLKMGINEATGLVWLIIPQYTYIEITIELRRILGINERNQISGTYEGDRPVNIITPKWLYIYLDQLSTGANMVDGAPSTLLAIVPAATSGVVNIDPPCPMYKKMEAGFFDQLKIRVLDENGEVVNNHGRPITAVLEIRENA